MWWYSSGYRTRQHKSEAIRCDRNVKDLDVSHTSNVGWASESRFFSSFSVTKLVSSHTLMSGFQLTRVLIVRGDEGSESSWSGWQLRLPGCHIQKKARGAPVPPVLRVSSVWQHFPSLPGVSAVPPPAFAEQQQGSCREQLWAGGRDCKYCCYILRMQACTLASLYWGCRENDEACKCICPTFVADVNEWREWEKLGKATRYEGTVVLGGWGTMGVAVEARVMVCIAFRPGLWITRIIWKQFEGLERVRNWTLDGLKLIQPLHHWLKISRVEMDLDLVFERNKIWLRSHVTQEILFTQLTTWMNRQAISLIRYEENQRLFWGILVAFIFQVLAWQDFGVLITITLFAGSMAVLLSNQELRSVISHPGSSRIHVGVGMWALTCSLSLLTELCTMTIEKIIHCQCNLLNISSHSPFSIQSYSYLV